MPPKNPSNNNWTFDNFQEINIKDANHEESYHNHHSNEEDSGENEEDEHLPAKQTKHKNLRLNASPLLDEELKQQKKQSEFPGK